MRNGSETEALARPTPLGCATDSWPLKDSHVGLGLLGLGCPLAGGTKRGLEAPDLLGGSLEGGPEALLTHLVLWQLLIKLLYFLFVVKTFPLCRG